MPGWDSTDICSAVRKQNFIRDPLSRATLLGIVCWIAGCGWALAEDQVDFKTRIAPILQQHCLRCHSPANAEGEVSLATSEDLTANEYVVAGKPDRSPLIELITSHNDEPPAMPKEGAPLSKEHVGLLRLWIQQGAIWPSNVVIAPKPKTDASWWSLQPLKVASEGKSIDDFLLAKLTAQGLSLSPPADRRTLIRRLTFDLHGLPPSPEDVETFVSDPDPQAYAKLVDRLLDSPHYGERFAQQWLDLAHYADTHGFERDKRRDHAWRYRDYVINALNNDTPYNRFLQEQIAGDVLWPTEEQAVLATGFLAAGPWDYVGQVETKSGELRRSARSLDLDDMATQVMTSTMATTINCCRCHDHKLDPITQTEYYQIRAVFAGLKRGDRVVNAAALEEQKQRRSALTAELAALESEISQLEGAGIDLADIVGGGDGRGSGAVRQGIDARSGAIETKDLRALGSVTTNAFVKSPSKFVDGVFIPDGKQGKVVVSSTNLPVDNLPSTSGAAWDVIRNGPVASQHSPKLGGVDFTSPGHSLLAIHANAGITFDLQAIRSASDITEMQFTAKLGYFGAAGGYWADAWVYLDGKLVAEFRKLGREQGLKPIDIKAPSDARFLTLISTDGGNGYGHDQIGFGDPKLTATQPATLSTADKTRLAKLRGDRDDVKQRLAAIMPSPTFYGVVGETPPPVHVLPRGSAESPEGEPVAPAALRSLAMLDPALGSVDTTEGERRAALARWITHPDNPRTPRVIVNRLWQHRFGRGIVNTPSDFGFGGEQPSHPDLLDWLARRLQQDDWSLKAINRLILNSKAYQQQSRPEHDAVGFAIDADNRLLWRQNPRRLEAEAIRDAVLHVSGKLNPERGGPGFEDFTYQEAYAPIYRYRTADEPALWRRSIYRFVIRTTPNRFLSTLDCPDPANLTAKRLTTTSPLQSLALYNNDFMLRQAGYLAQRIKQEAGTSPGKQVVRAFALAFGRSPSPAEHRLAEDFVEAQGLFALCRSLLNSNEFVYVD